MTTKKNLVNLVLMSIVTVVASFSFTSCSDDSDLLNESANPLLSQEREYNGPALEPYGLPFQEFINEDDVKILNADTTQISVSKKLADKLGIKTFVGHPMGIWENMEVDPYMRKATREKLVGDRYILDVKECALAELLNGRNTRLSSDLFVNTDQASVRSRAASENIPEYAAKFVDDNDMVHPVAVTLMPPAEGEQEATRHGLTTYGTFSTEDLYMAQQSGSRWSLWGAIKDLGNKIKKAGEKLYDEADKATQYDIKKYYPNQSLVKANTTFEKKIEFGVGQKHRQKKDTFNVTVKCPIDFALSYTFILDAKGSAVSLPTLNRLETSIAGKFDFAPQVTIGYSKGWELPDDKQRYRLWTFPPVKLTFMIGIIPIVIDLDPYLFLKFEAQVSGSVYTGFKYHYASHFKFGVEHTNKWNLISEYVTDENRVDMIPPTAEFKAHAGVGLMLGCDMMVMKVAGPKIALGPKLTSDMELHLNQDPEDCYFKSSLDFNMGGEIGAKIKIWKFELADWSTDLDFGLNKNIFHYNFPHEEGDEENGSFDNILKLLNPYKSWN